MLHAEEYIHNKEQQNILLAADLEHGKNKMFFFVAC